MERAYYNHTMKLNFQGMFSFESCVFFISTLFPLRLLICSISKCGTGCMHLVSTTLNDYFGIMWLLLVSISLILFAVSKQPNWKWNLLLMILITTVFKIVMMVSRVLSIHKFAAFKNHIYFNNNSQWYWYLSVCGNYFVIEEADFPLFVLVFGYSMSPVND